MIQIGLSLRQERQQSVSYCRLLILSLLILSTQNVQVIAAVSGERMSGVPRSNNSAQNDEALPLLEMGKPLERELSGGQSHSYQVSMTAGQSLHLIVEQYDMGLNVALFTPDDKKIIEVGTSNEMRGPEPLWFIADAAGVYRIEVYPQQKEAKAGRYRVKLEELRAATEGERNQVKAQAAFAEGTQLSSKGAAESTLAIEKFEESLRLWRLAGNRSMEAKTLYYIGETYTKVSEFQKAIAYLNQALSLSRTLGERQREAAALYEIGWAYHLMSELEKALDFCNQALALWRASGDKFGEARALNGLGVVYRLKGENQKALDFHIQALALRRALGQKLGEAASLNNLGAIYRRLGDTKKALGFYNEALTLLRALGRKRDEAAVLHNIGVIYEGMGETQKALDSFNQALLNWRALGDRPSEATTLDGLAVIHIQMGEARKALEFHNQALALKRALGNKRNEAITLYNIGVTYQGMGELEKSLDGFNQALPIMHAFGDKVGESHVLDGLGGTYKEMGELEKALGFYNQSLVISRTSGNKRNEAATLSNIGWIYQAREESEKALEFFNQALSLRRTVGDRRGEAETLEGIGAAYQVRGESEKALEFFNQSLSLALAVGDKWLESTVLYRIAQVERHQGKLDEARGRIESALASTESLRNNIGGEGLRTSYLASVYDHYEFYIALLMSLHQLRPAQGYDALALQASERARARSLRELLSDSGSDIQQGIAPLLLEKERLLHQQLNAKTEKQMRLSSDKSNEQQAATLKKEIDELLGQLQEIKAQIRVTSPRYATLTQPEPLKLQELQKSILEPDMLLLEYALGDEKSYLWAVTQTTIKSFELPRRSEVEDKARQVYELLTARNAHKRFETVEERQRRVARADAEYVTASAELSQMILGPTAADLQGKRLLVVSDGALQYIPFAALPIPQTISRPSSERVKRESLSPPTAPTSSQSLAGFVPLVTEHEIVNLPSALSLVVLRRELAGRKPAAKTLAVLADPVFEKDDIRVKAGKNVNNLIAYSNDSTESQRGTPPLLEAEIMRSVREIGNTDGALKIRRLPFTRREAKEISALIPASERKEALDFAASIETATSAELGQYRYIHFATHGLINSSHPELSGIVLSLVNEQGEAQDGFLRAYKIYNLKLPAELVVLSGCRTGLGKEIKGEGIVGLTRGFMYAGAARVLVSLWDVSDKASAELMGQLYKELLGRKRLRTSAALRSAQLKLSKNKHWQAPYYWAAFVLQGEPK
jgi:CHAT domain-containing protein/Flp pilus assembly protein TadD